MLSSFSAVHPQQEAQSLNARARSAAANPASPSGDNNRGAGPNPNPNPKRVDGTAIDDAVVPDDRRRRNATRRVGGGRVGDIVDEPTNERDHSRYEASYDGDDYSFGPTGGSASGSGSGSERGGRTAPAPSSSSRSTRSNRSLFAQEEEEEADAAPAGGHDLSSIGKSSSSRGGGGGGRSSFSSSSSSRKSPSQHQTQGSQGPQGAPASPSQSALDAAQISARRRIDREAKMRAMEDAVARGRDSLRNVYVGNTYTGAGSGTGTGTGTTSSTYSSSSSGSGGGGGGGHPNDSANRGLTAMPNLDDVTLREDGRFGSPNHLPDGGPSAGSRCSPDPTARQMAGLLLGGGGSGSAHHQGGGMAPPLAERIRNLMPTHWGSASASNQGFGQGRGQDVGAGANPGAYPGAYPGASLSSRSLTTSGRNLHDIGTAVPKPPRRAFLSSASSAGGGDDPNGGGSLRLANSGITIDFYDPDTEAAQWSANGNTHDDDAHLMGGGGGGGRSSSGWIRGFNTLLTQPIREVMPTNRRKCILWVAALAILGVVFGALAKVEETSNTFGVSGANGGSKTPPPTKKTPTSDDPHDKSPGASSNDPPPPKVQPTFANPNLTKDGRTITTAGKGRMSTILSRILDSGVTDPGALPTQDQVESKDGPFRGAAPPDDATPQLKALAWIALYDERQVTPDDEYLLERYALAVFWHATYEVAALADVAMPPEPGTQNEYNFLKHDGWMTHLGVCSWMGVQCHHLGVDKSAVRYDADHTVTYLNLTRNSVRGTIPEELWTTFVDLRVLDLSHNMLAGSIGEEIGEWDDLEVVYLNDNFLEGSIPTTLFQPNHESKLEIFDAGNNFIAGPIPNNIGRLANLKRLALYSCWLTGTIPLSIAELKRLNTLYIDENTISGTIPTEIGGLSDLRDLRLRDNKMNGEIPSELGKLKNLEILYLDTNEFEGQVPAEVGLMTRLEELHLYKNKFTSKIPWSLGDLRYLKLLYLDSNGFTGSIPDSYGGSLHNLHQFYIYGNKITGTIPSNIWGLEDLEELRMNDCMLEGSLPEELGDLLKLRTLHLENNKFLGTLPDRMKNLEELEKLRISGNGFGGEVPDGLCLLRTSESGSGSLEEFVADCDAFQPACPCCTECVSHNKPAQEKPDVHEEPEADPTAAPTPTPQEVADDINETGRSDRLNQIKHRLVDKGISSADALKPAPKGQHRSAQRKALEWIADEDERQLAASHDFLFERFALASLWYATFDYARLYDQEHPPKKGEDPLPNWLHTNNWMTPAPICSWFGVTCHESNSADGSIDQFNITNNGVRGYVPDEFYKGLTDVTVLDLSHNLFNGTIADGVGHWEDLRLLYMNQNFFTGSLPASIFSPAHKSQLEIIDLGGNWLSGMIPNEIGDLSNLVRLALYENWISGTIPPFIANCKKLDTLYLDSNDLSGTIPRMLVTELIKLQDLRLRSNHLKGHIPEAIGDNLQQLKLLYLDDNELAGSIPSSIGLMSRLEELHLYKNKLTGTLPEELGKLRYLSLLYIDSNSLTGSIPDSFGDLHSLQQLFMFQNKLTGQIPAGIYGIEDVSELRLNNNGLFGSLPEEIGDLLKLRVLHLENNSFAGVLPATLGNMDELQVLRVQNNQFESPVADEICLLRQGSLNEFVSDCEKIGCKCCTECS